ncbi:MAG: RDD family protein [Pseudomonadota bacterium]
MTTSATVDANGPNNRQRDGARLRSRERTLITPEGVDLRIRLAEGGERTAAFFIDISIIASLLLVAALVSALFGVTTGSAEFIAVVWLLSFFLLRAFYFTFFELGLRAATPGKRALGIRVAVRNGGRLKAEAVVSRNAMREVEIFLPLGFLVGHGTGGVDAIIVLVGFAWSAIFAFFPLFNADRLRPGDIVAGTWVVKAPKRQLKPDIADTGEYALKKFEFTKTELDAYGVHELHVLEGVLRSRDKETLELVAKRIRTKIGRRPQDEEKDPEFLEAYYTALRKYLETRLLYGVRRRDKFDKR